jgi:phage-related protein
VWWPNQKDRRSAAQEEFTDLPARAQGELLERMMRFEQGRTRANDLDNLGGGIKELRVRIGSNPYRVLFFIDGRIPVALTCFHKNQRRTPRRDLNRAKKRMQSYLRR